MRDPIIDLSKDLHYTPLILNPVSSAGAFFKGESSAEHFIGVKSIKVDDKFVPLNTSLLSINEKGFGGTKISTVEPYTVLETSIFKAVVAAFVKGFPDDILKVKPEAPFGACFSTKKTR